MIPVSTNYINFPPKEKILSHLQDPKSYPYLTNAERVNVATAFSWPIQNLATTLDRMRMYIRNPREIGPILTKAVKETMSSFKEKRAQEIADSEKTMNSSKNFLLSDGNEAAKLLFASLQFKPSKAEFNQYDLHGNSIDLEEYAELALKILSPAIASCGRKISTPIDAKGRPPLAPSHLAFHLQKENSKALEPAPLPPQG